MGVCDPIAIRLDLQELGEKLRIRRADDWAMLRALLEVAKPHILPRAAYRVSFLSEKTFDGVKIDGIHLKSHLLRRNLDEVQRIFPFVATIGSKLEEMVSFSEDLLEKYYLDMIGNIALIETCRYLEKILVDRFLIEGLSYISPGSLSDWKIQEQRPLFSLLSGLEKSIGVELKDNLIMFPRKSVSGIFFHSNITFHSCQICPREHCETRKIDFDPEIAKAYDRE